MGGKGDIRYTMGGGGDGTLTKSSHIQANKDNNGGSKERGEAAKFASTWLPRPLSDNIRI
jgi:hypothetical protein